MELKSHFDTLAPGVEPDGLRNIIVDKMFNHGEVINKYNNSTFFKKKSLIANSYPLEDVRWISLEVPTKKELIVKAFYPASVRGIKTEVVITEITEDNRGYEANIKAEFLSGFADVNFFDPFYSFNSHLYSTNKPIDFYFSGLAYSMQKSIPREVEVDGESYRIDGAAIFAEINDFCDYQFMLTIEELEEIYFDDELIYKIYGLVINHPDSETIFGINLYVSAKNIITENYIPQIGDSIEGLFWLQGYHNAFSG